MRGINVQDGPPLRGGWRQGGSDCLPNRRRTQARVGLNVSAKRVPPLVTGRAAVPAKAATILQIVTRCDGTEVRSRAGVWRNVVVIFVPLQGEGRTGRRCVARLLRPRDRDCVYGFARPRDGGKISQHSTKRPQSGNQIPALTTPVNGSLYGIRANPGNGRATG
jgi:hypothetical protein